MFSTISAWSESCQNLANDKFMTFLLDHPANLNFAAYILSSLHNRAVSRGRKTCSSNLTTFRIKEIQLSQCGTLCKQTFPVTVSQSPETCDSVTPESAQKQMHALLPNKYVEVASQQSNKTSACIFLLRWAPQKILNDNTAQVLSTPV